LRRVVGDGSINAYAASIGAGDQVTEWCSAPSAGHMLAQLAQRPPGQRGLDADTARRAGDDDLHDRINWYLPNVLIAHEVSMDGSVRNDCAVVFMAGDPFAICVFTTVDDAGQGNAGDPRHRQGRGLALLALSASRSLPHAGRRPGDGPERCLARTRGTLLRLAHTRRSVPA
jgi:hypothetical protein